MLSFATRTTVRVILLASIYGVAGSNTARSQEERKPTNPLAGVFRAENLGIEYMFVEYNGHLAAKIRRITSPNAPVLKVARNDGTSGRLEAGDLIVAMDDQVFDAPKDVNDHVDDTTIDFIDKNTGERMRGTLRLPSSKVPNPAGESLKIRALIVIDSASKLAGLDQDCTFRETMYITPPG